MNDTHNPLISVVILNYNGEELLKKCLRSVLGSAYDHFEVLVVDNASTDQSADNTEACFREDARIRFIRLKTNVHFTGGMNAGMREARGVWVVLLGNDTEIDADFLGAVVRGLTDKNIAAASPKIYITGRGKVLDNTGGGLDRLGYGEVRGRLKVDRGQYDRCGDIFFASGSAPIYRREALLRVGFFDPAFMAHSEDVDLSWRMRLYGYKIVYLPSAIVYHAISRTIAKTSTRAQLLYHIRKNRIALLIKNYAFFNLIGVLPVTVATYGMIFLKELLISRQPKSAVTAVTALIWNVRSVSYLLRQRAKVQRDIRRCPDSLITAAMIQKPLFLKELQGFFARTRRS